MPIFRYRFGTMELEVTAPSREALDMRDPCGDGQRLSFEPGGKIIVDFGFRVAAEESGARLNYRILDGHTEVFSANGPANDRVYRGGERLERTIFKF